MSIRTDLAIETHELYEEANSNSIPGVDVSLEGDNEIFITKVNITNKEAAKTMGKPVGHYTTIEIPRLMDNDRDLYEDAARVVAEQVGNMINLEGKPVILVVGLGNWKVTPDSLGPKVVEHLLVTRHVKEYLPEQLDENVNSVCALTPGVLGITGMETGEVIKGVVDKIKPTIVIAIDALAARKMYRVNRTIQISDTGIAPGAGIGNHRMELNEKSLGIPVIGIGVPTVVDAATIASDTIDLAIETLLNATEDHKVFYESFQGFDEQEKYNLIKEVLTPYGHDLMVTPKEIDLLMNQISKIIANGLNIAIHPGVNTDDVDRFIN